MKHSISFTSCDEAITAYLRGETIPFDGEKGWYLVCVDGYSLGWAKLTNNMLKNHYPKGIALELIFPMDKKSIATYE